MDEQLEKLITSVLKAPEGSLERKKAISRLIARLSTLPELLTSRHPDFANALNKTWMWVAKNIQDFDPNKPNIVGDTLQECLVNWINGYLRYRIKDLYYTSSKKVNESRRIYKDHTLTHTEVGELTNVGEEISDVEYINLLDQQASTDITVHTLQGIDLIIEKEQQKNLKRIGLAVREFIEQDLDNCLQNCYFKHTHCNCKILIKRLYFQEKPEILSNISREFNVNYQSLNTHLKRKCFQILRDFITQQLKYNPRK